MQAGVAAVIFDVVCDLFLKILKQKSALHIIIAVAAFTAVFFFNVNVIAVIAAAALLGAAVALIKVKKECKK